MENKLSLSTGARWVTIVILGLTPLIFVPLTQDFYDATKLSLLIAGSSIILLLTGISLVQPHSRLHITLSSGFIAFGALSLASLISLGIASADKVEALVNPLGAATLLSLTILVVAASACTAKEKGVLSWAFYLSITALNLIAIYQFFGMGKIMFPSLSFLQDNLWTPTGTTAATVAVSLLALTVLIPDTLTTLRKQAQEAKATLLILALLVIVAGTTLSLWQFIPKISSSLMPVGTAWTVTLETLKSAKAAVVGTGAENFVSAYTSGKPASLMNTPLWNVRFSTSADLFLHMATVYGLLGLLASLVFTYVCIKHLRASVMTCGVAVLTLFLFPPTLTLLAAFALLFALFQKEEVPIKTTTVPFARYAAAVILLLTSLLGFYGVVKYYVGERYYFQALTEAQRNEGTSTYNSLVRAIRTNTSISRYHITLSQVSLSLANALATETLTSASATSSATTDSNRQLISQLIQQSIAEAKVAATLNTQSIAAWENLGNTYQTVMSVASGSDAWAAASYQKALSLDPTNPVLMVNLGGVLVHQKKYDEAITVFNQAILLKPDFANAYYNLANAYELKGDTLDAKSALTKTMTLVPPGSSDYVRVKNDLNSLEGKFIQNAQAPSSGSSTLTLPQ